MAAFIVRNTAPTGGGKGSYTAVSSLPHISLSPTKWDGLGQGRGENQQSCGLLLPDCGCSWEYCGQEAKSSGSPRLSLSPQPSPEAGSGSTVSMRAMG